MMIWRNSWCGISLVFFMAMNTVVHAEDEITITSGRDAPFVTAEGDGFYDLIVKEIFQRVGIKAKTVLLPAERSLVNANSGIDDGNIARIKGLEKKYTDLRMVPGKIIDFDFLVFTKDKQFTVDGWKSLKPYNVAYINGWKLFEKKVTHYRSLTKAQDSAQLFGLLENDRADVVLFDRWSGIMWLKQHPVNIRFLQPPLASMELFLYVNKKHQRLVPQLADALQSMKLDGTYIKIYDRTLGRFSK